MRKFLYLPSGYKNRKHAVTTGVAKTGEVSPKGTVTHTEDWEGRVAADVAPAQIHLVVDPDGSIRNMTHEERLERGYFIPGRGPRSK